MKFLLLICLSISLLATVIGQDTCIPEDQRIDCHPDADANEENCHTRGCLWCTAADGIPWCHLPANYGYRMSGPPVELPNGYRVDLVRATNISYIGGDSETLTAIFEFQSDQRLRINITDGTDRYQVPLEIHPTSSGPTVPLYRVVFSNDPVFSFQVIRRETGTILFDTSLGGLTFADQFIQIGIKIPSRNAYGIGENEQKSYRHDFSKYQTFALWALDQAPSGNVNLYGVHPYYTVVENDGNAHSVVMVNSNAQEFILSPAPAYTYRTIGGLLDMYIFLGPTPEDTVKQLTQAIGRQPIPPYWSLGFQLSRWGYDNIENMKAAVQRTKDANIPQDVQYADIDIMDHQLDFTFDNNTFAGFPEYVDELKRNGIKFVPIVDPGIKINEPGYPSLISGDEMDVWIKRPDGTPMVGTVWPGAVHFPDFSRPSTLEWWTMNIKEFHNLYNWDGIWIDMNEPANWSNGDEEVDCNNNTLNYPPYVPAIRDRDLTAGTLCADYIQDFGLHYNTHSLYGWSESRATSQAVQETLGKRSFVLTRSTYLGVGNWAAHWLGDNFSAWNNLHASIIGILQYNTFGVPFVGADICGFLLEATEEMCTRWQQLGAFYPFSRNHNVIGSKDQDPGAWSEVSKTSTRTALEIRYTLLPYLYYLFYQHKTTGSTVVRALWHEFPADSIALGVDRQFLWGPGFLVTPVVDEGMTTVEAYFPPGRWYSYYDGSEVENPGLYTLPAPIGFINLHVRGGHILPTQDHALNTELSRQNPFGFIVALDGANSSVGGMYYDDGDSIEPQETGMYFSSTLDFSWSGNTGTLKQTVVTNGYADIEDKVLGSVRLLGASGPIRTVLVNNVAHTDFTVLPSGEVKVNNLMVPINSEFSIAFSN